MPNLEAPIGYDESSPDNSYSAEAVDDVPTVGEPMQPLPAGAVEIRVQPPETPANVRRLPVLSPHPVRVRPLPRFSDFDRDIAALEEENHWPVVPVVQLLPINLPPQLPEPSLDELLRRVTGRNDLHNVEIVRLRVISYSISLARLPLFLPRLQHLDLSGSVLCSLRDLGYGLMHLNYLNVSNCGLNSFDGTSGLPAVRTLIADGNMIQRVDPLTELPLLQHLSAQNNRISDLGLLTFLGLCPNLRELELQGNPVVNLSLYRTTMQRSVPTLRLLDGATLGEENVTQATIVIESANVNSSTDGEISSLSSELYSDSSHAESNASSLPIVAVATRRPATAPQRAASERSGSNQLQRPASVSHSAETRRNSLSMGAPVVGSVVSLARRNRRQRRQAWTTSSNSSSSNSSTHSPLGNESFELRLPTLQQQMSSDSND
ncbi:internalin I [Anastrepha obliqua]|uniref:internalin I n=1 Tax=Anastrepha obliqua TaxID=95512 RepID=UPI002409DF87|nr:internalin I [Anastrepha obliqua]XP_054735390.1 internalin I [Anastrepha obliqua]XP_054735391.1 internalin I [Anastrepha obliqua]XP_054735393.1 internalin I [Anastrepha obliqua]